MIVPHVPTECLMERQRRLNLNKFEERYHRMEEINRRRHASHARKQEIEAAMRDSMEERLNRSTIKREVHKEERLYAIALNGEERDQRIVDASRRRDVRASDEKELRVATAVEMSRRIEAAQQRADAHAARRQEEAIARNDEEEIRQWAARERRHKLEEEGMTDCLHVQEQLTHRFEAADQRRVALQEETLYSIAQNAEERDARIVDASVRREQRAQDETSFRIATHADVVQKEMSARQRAEAIAAKRYEDIAWRNREGDERIESARHRRDELSMNGSLRCEHIQNELAHRMQNASQRAAQIQEARYISLQEQGDRNRNKQDHAASKRADRARREAESRNSLKMAIDYKVQRTKQFEAEYERMKQEMDTFRHQLTSSQIKNEVV